MTHLVGHPLTTSPPLEKIAIKKKKSSIGIQCSNKLGASKKTFTISKGGER